MLWAVAIASAAEPGDTVTLRIGVHRDAGTAWQVAADGAAGQCTTSDVAIHCPATGPVRFRWAGDPAWVLDGDAELSPGQVGQAWILADEASRSESVARLAPERATAADVADLFIRTGDHPVEPPSRAMIDALLALASSPDVAVRKEVVSAVVPLFRHTASDPFPIGSPPLVPVGWITTLAHDEDPRVRRRLANRLRDLLEPGEPVSEEATAALLELVPQGGGVQRAALASLGIRAHVDEEPALETWRVSLERVTTDGPPGRAAANTLAHLASALEPGPEVDPAQAVQLVYTFHRERTWRVWAAWRADVPFDPILAEGLLRETVGYSPALIKSWAATDPDGLVEVLRAWEPGPPHSERFQAIHAAADNLSLDPEGTRGG